LRKPDKPIYLQNQYGVSNAFLINIVWQDGVEDGGTDIIDYRVWYD